MNPNIQTFLLAAGTSLLVSLVGLAVVFAVARRNAAVAASLAPLTVVVAVACGVVVSAQRMLISEHDLTTMWFVLLGAAPTSLIVGLITAQRANRLQKQAQTEEAARRAEAEVERQRRDLVAWVSHDLRTPLAGMRAMVEALQDGVATDPAGYLLKLGEQIDRLSAMVDDLLSLSRIESGQLRLHLERVSLREVLSDTLVSAEVLAADRSIKLVGSCPSVVVANVDEQQLSRALSNLVVNAVRHTPVDGVVTLSGSRDGSECLVTVVDQCGGIPESDIGRVFEAGWRGNPARSPSAAAGAGLGLAVVRGIVEAHGGQVDVRNVEGGCRFEIRLPLAAGA